MGGEGHVVAARAHDCSDRSEVEIRETEQCKGRSNLG